ncbi:unnamed protein product [Didymodactylos carnosus]|uniref:Nuclear receptor domain-containing protein n=1 Tax=Didymodactylos carnosus TaxID=1234261 RepID=A0A8S2IR87_9BILA|nr:unnamed protein product [Didymodactylos carnosus]CAF3772561.1 unnamed protein product [Didymodactylos carnosus]
MEPCPQRCTINKNNRNNCASCRYDKCKFVGRLFRSLPPNDDFIVFVLCTGMAVDKIRFGKPPKTSKSSAFDSLFSTSIKLQPNSSDYRLMQNLLECYQSFDDLTTNNNHPSSSTSSTETKIGTPPNQTETSSSLSIIFEFCHRLASIIVHDHEKMAATLLSRLKRHESALKFLITGEPDNDRLSSWGKEPQAWLFANRKGTSDIIHFVRLGGERWRLIMILLILSYDDDEIGGGLLCTNSTTLSDNDYESNENLSQYATLITTTNSATRLNEPNKISHVDSKSSNYSSDINRLTSSLISMDANNISLDHQQQNLPLLQQRSITDVTDTVIERVLRLFELEYDQEVHSASSRINNLSAEESKTYTIANDEHLKRMKSQFILRFIDMMASCNTTSTQNTLSTNYDLTNYSNLRHSSPYHQHANFQQQQPSLNQSHHTQNLSYQAQTQFHF